MTPRHVGHLSLGLGLAVASALGLAIATGGPAHGYAEDVCPSPSGNGWVKCEVDIVPTLAGVSRLLLQQVLPDGSRSTLHVDSTYVLAEAMGLTPDQAMTVASYDGATDLGQYIHRNAEGARVPRYNTASLPGISRVDFAGGGIFLHFMAPVTGVGPRDLGAVTTQSQAGAGTPLSTIDGLRPDPTDPVTEPVLANARRWAWGRGPLCVAGLTVRSPNGDYATGRSCYHRADGSLGQILTSMPSLKQLGEPGDLNWVTPLGEVMLTAPGAMHPVPASHIADLTGAQAAPLARFGIYLHALQDRVSHHRCIDTSYAVGPRDPATSVLVDPMAFLLAGLSQGGSAQAEGATLVAHPDFIATFTPTWCDQVTHEALHQLETGTDQSTVDPQDRTAEAGLQATARELRAWVRSPYGRGVIGHRARAMAPRKVGHLIDALVRAEEVARPGARLSALSSVAHNFGLAPVPGF